MQLTSGDLQGFSNGYLGPDSVLVLLPSSDILDDRDLPLYNIHICYVNHAEMKEVQQEHQAAANRKALLC